MVAYSFESGFVDAIQKRIKRQTIRLPRPRHAHPGERVQLFQGMRTKACQKIIPDPMCIAVDRLVIDTRSGKLDHVEINGISLQIGSDELAAFAHADGFGRIVAWAVDPAAHFERWWVMVHGRALHEDLVLIRWEDRP